MRPVVTVVVLLALAGCHKYSDRLADGGPDDATEGEGEGDGPASLCPGAAMSVQATLANSSEAAPLVIDGAGAPIVLFGQTSDNGATFASLKGFFSVGGYTPGATVTAQIVSKPCATSGCPTTFGIRFFDTQNLTNAADGTCGTTTVTADGDGALLFRATGGGTGGGGGGGTGGGGGGGGPNGPDTGLLLTP